MDRLDYAQAVSRVKALETRVVNKPQLDRMIDSSSAEDALKVIQEGEYSVHMSKINRPEEFHKILSDELTRLYDLMYEVSPDDKFVDMMSIRYDYHNIKVLLKATALSTNLDYLLVDVGTVDKEKLKLCIEQDDYTELTITMAEAIADANEVFATDGDPQQLDIVLDKYMYADMLARSEGVGSQLIVDLLKINIDLINIKTFLRVKKHDKDIRFLRDVLIPGGSIEEETFINGMTNWDFFIKKLSNTSYSQVTNIISESQDSGNLALIEKLSEDYITDYLEQTKYISFGPEPLLAYLITKETEIKNIRIIMVGKLNNVEPTRLKERLRDLYV